MRKTKPTTAPYIRPHHYTAEELIDAEIADLESDIQCAERDGLPEYAAECRLKLAKLISNRSQGK